MENKCSPFSNYDFFEEIKEMENSRFPTLLRRKLFPYLFRVFVYLHLCSRPDETADAASNSGVMEAVWLFVPTVKIGARRTARAEFTHCCNIQIAAGECVKSDTGQRKLSASRIKKLHGLSPRANYADRVTAACRRS
jgi:hypothetical protein